MGNKHIVRCDQWQLHTVVQEVDRVRSLAAAITQATNFACAFAAEVGVHKTFGMPLSSVCYYQCHSMY